MKRPTKKYGSATYETLIEGQTINWTIPTDAKVNPNIGGCRAVIFDVILRTRVNEPQRFRFSCFSDNWKPGDVILGRLKLGLKRMREHQPQMYARLDETHNRFATHELHLCDDEGIFAEKRGITGAQAFSFPRKPQIGGAVVHPLTQDPDDYW